MVDKTLSSIVGGGDIRLAPDLDLPSRIAGTGIYSETVVFDPSGSLTEALGLSGRYAVFGLSLLGLPTAELVTVKLTVDGVIIWNEVDFTPTQAIINLYGDMGTTAAIFSPFIVNSALSLEVKTAADSAVTLTFAVRPIL